MGITGAGIVFLSVFTLRGIAGFREDYLYLRKIFSKRLLQILEK